MMNVPSKRHQFHSARTCMFMLVINTTQEQLTLSVLSWLPVMTLPSMTPKAQMGLWWALSLWLILHSRDSSEGYACEPFTLIWMESSACIAPGTALEWTLLFRGILGEDRFIGELSSKGVFKLGLQKAPRLRNSKDPSKRATTIWGLMEKQKQSNWLVHSLVRSFLGSFVRSLVRSEGRPLVCSFVGFLSNDFLLINNRIR